MLTNNQSATHSSFNLPTENQSATNQIYLTDEDELFTVRTANTWLKQANKRAIPKMLFGKFWYQGELCILFADSNLGKSILAVQIANAISTGDSVNPFDCEAEMQPVLYCDFELTEKQFEARYSIDYEDHYEFNEKFFRAELNPDNEVPPGFKDFDEYLSACLERSIVQTGSKVVVIDNLTYLRSENEKAKDALPLMKHLKALKNRYGLSILALAHTPKRDMALPITRNDLQGSKMLMNFCDSAFAIGESTIDKNRRYLKQIKQRNTGQEYGANNVCICEVVKPGNFLLYQFEGYGTEADHLRKPKSGISPGDAKEAMRLSESGMSLRDIAGQMGKSFQQVDRMIKAAKLQTTLM
jgi:archaellum biogenesis ATPase FlaH